MNRFFIITNHSKDPGLTVTNSIAAYLKDHQAEVSIREPRGLGAARHTGPEEVPEGTECILVLGGDGTLMRAAGDLVTLGIPLLGINLGTLGYLAEIDRNSVYVALDALLQDRYQTEERMMLHGDVWHEGKIIYSNRVLNDILVIRDGTPHVMSIRNYVNDKYLNEYRADGLIVSTPTGSTGYSLSAGGPIIAPQAELFLLTPLAAHTLNARSVILPVESRIRIVVGPGRDNTTEHALATFDGESNVPLITGDYVEIRKAEKSVQILKIQDDSFLEILRRKIR
ncbi:MAG: NAD(+)/NADH kinase [Eubacterium sp.]|nr:NAD(+)/NADH kinase [Eubacterium sp.]